MPDALPKQAGEGPEESEVSDDVVEHDEVEALDNPDDEVVTGDDLVTDPADEEVPVTEPQRKEEVQKAMRETAHKNTQRKQALKTAHEAPAVAEEVAEEPKPADAE